MGVATPFLTKKAKMLINIRRGKIVYLTSFIPYPRERTVRRITNLNVLFGHLVDIICRLFFCVSNHSILCSMRDRSNVSLE